MIAAHRRRSCRFRFPQGAKGAEDANRQGRSRPLVHRRRRPLAQPRTRL